MSQEEFNKQYELDIRTGRIGGGAFGTVYKAYDHVNSLWKAIKIAEVKYIDGKEFSLISEFDATKDLAPHPNIANYEAVFQFQKDNGLFDYAVMQYYQSGNLKQLLQYQELTLVQQKQICKGILSGLEYLHYNNVIHRDIKPSNILIAKFKDKYVPKIADFGLSKLASAEISNINNSFAGGTLEYSSPEQLKGEPIKYNSDLWAAGVIMFEVFIGENPFGANSNTLTAAARRIQVMKNINEGEISSKINTIPEPYKAAIVSCLNRDISIRAQSAIEVLAFISSVEDNAGISKENGAADQHTPIEVAENLTKVIPKNKIDEILNHEKVNRKRLILEEEVKKKEELNKIKDKELAKKEEEELRLKKIEEQKIAEESRIKKIEDERIKRIEKAKANELEVLENKRIKEERKILAQQKEHALELRKKERALKRNKQKAKVGKFYLKHRKKAIFLLLICFISGGIYQLYLKAVAGPQMYSQNGLYGFVSEEGDTIISSTYINAEPFLWGKAFLFTDSVKYTINIKGERIDSVYLFENNNGISPPDDKDIAHIIVNPAINNGLSKELESKHNESDKKDRPFQDGDDNQNGEDKKDLGDVEKEISGQKDEDTSLTKSDSNSDDKDRDIKDDKGSKLIADIPNIDNSKTDIVADTKLPKLILELNKNVTNVSGGSFLLGCVGKEDDCQKDEKPTKQLKMGDIYISKYEVTQSEYKSVIGNNPSYNKSCDHCPVENVSWNDAQAFINRLNGIQNIYRYRLPTEAEWEYIALGGKEFIYAGSNNANDVAQYKSNNGVGSVSVYKTKANNFKINGMSGNVSEWCQDWYTEKGYGFSGKQEERVIRGGSWNDRKRALRCKNRGHEYPDVRKPTIGFRIVRELK